MYSTSVTYACVIDSDIIHMREVDVYSAPGPVKTTSFKCKINRGAYTVHVYKAC